MDCRQLSRIIDLAILTLTLAFGLVFVFSEVFAATADRALLERLDFAFTAAFVALFALQLALVQDRIGWLRTNWLDILIVVVVAFPLLRLLRFHRFIPLARTLRLIRLSAVLGEALRAHIRACGRGHFYNILVAGVVVMFLGAVVVHFYEDGASEANIKSFGDGLWWAVTTVTTVGYGDKYPTTVAGRLVASAVMILGIGLFGVLTGSISSFVVAQTQESEIARLHAEIAALRHDIAALAKGLNRERPT